MSITAKELAKIMGLSEAAISMALNGKPGVSTETRKRVIETAHNYSYDFTKLKKGPKNSGTICYIVYRKYGAILKMQNTPFFEQLSNGIEQHCKEKGYRLVTANIVAGNDVDKQLERAIPSDCVGIVLLGTEMLKEDFFPFSYISLPIVAIDTYINSTKMDCVLMNSMEGAYQATRFLIKKKQVQPGYLKSSYLMYNFAKRSDGFYKALRDSGLSTSKSVVHHLSPSMEGAYADMKKLLTDGCEVAKCYFADNDLIAAGAMKAFKEFGYRIPEDVGIVGFDNIPMCTYLEPNLTTINIPIRYMAEMAITRLDEVINSRHYRPVKIEVNTNLIRRQSV